MKFLWRIAFIGVFFSPLALAEVTVVKKKTTQLRAFQNFESRIAGLENYSVAYLESDKKKTYVVLKSAPARQTQRNDDLTVELRPAKKKS